MTSLLTGIFILASCSPAASPTMPPASMPTTTSTMYPTATQTHTPILPQKEQITPTPSPTPNRPDLPVISVENASQIREERIIGDGRINQIRISPDGDIIAAALSIGLRLLDSQTLEERGFLESTIPVSSVDFSPDGQLLALGYESGLVRVYEVEKLTGITHLDRVQPFHEIKAHTFLVTTVQFSPDGSMLASASRDRTANIWKVADGKKIRPLGGFALTVIDINFSSDNTFVAAGSIDGTMRVWEIKSGNLVNQAGEVDKKRKQEGEYPSTLVFDPQSADIISGWGDGSLRSWHWQDENKQPEKAGSSSGGIIDLVWQHQRNLVSLDDDGNLISWQTRSKDNAIDLMQVWEDEQPSGITGIAVTKGGIWVLSRHPGIIELYDSESKSGSKYYYRDGHGGRTTTAIFSSDDRILISAGSDGAMRLWDVDNPIRSKEIVLEQDKTIIQLSTSRDNRWLAVAIDKQVDVFSLQSILQVFSDDLIVTGLKPEVSISTGDPVHCISLSEDGSMLAVSVLQANNVQIYSIPGGKKLTDIKKFEHPVEALAFSTAGNTLAVGAKDHRVFLWQDLDASLIADLEAGKKVNPLYIKGGYVVTSLVWNHRADSLAVIGTFKQAHANNPQDGQVRIYLNGATDQLTTAIFSPDDTLIASAGVDGIIRLYETKHGKLLTELKGHSGMVNHLLFSPSGSRLVSCGEDGTIRIWSIPSQQSDPGS